MNPTGLQLIDRTRDGTKEDLPVHWVVSGDEARTWSQPRPTNLPGQVCAPVGLPVGRVAVD